MGNLDDQVKKTLDNISNNQKEPSETPKINMKDPRYDTFSKKPVMKDPQNLNEGFEWINLKDDK